MGKHHGIKHALKKAKHSVGKSTSVFTGSNIPKGVKKTINSPSFIETVGEISQTVGEVTIGIGIVTGQPEIVAAGVGLEAAGKTAVFVAGVEKKRREIKKRHKQEGITAGTIIDTGRDLVDIATSATDLQKEISAGDKKLSSLQKQAREEGKDITDIKSTVGLLIDTAKKEQSKIKDIGKGIVNIAKEIKRDAKHQSAVDKELHQDLVTIENTFEDELKKIEKDEDKVIGGLLDLVDQLADRNDENNNPPKLVREFIKQLSDLSPSQVKSYLVRNFITFKDLNKQEQRQVLRSAGILK